MPLHPALVTIFAVAAGLGALATVWHKILGPAWRKTRSVYASVDAFLDDWNGEPAQPARPGRPAVPARPGVLARLDHQRNTLATHSDHIEQIRHQVLPNGGSSIRDAVARIERNQSAQVAAHDSLAATLAEHIEISQADREDLRHIVEQLQAERADMHAAVDALSTETTEHHDPEQE